MQTTTSQVQNSGNLGTNESKEVAFDEESFGPLMTILSNLYSNKAEAVIREYSANAYDSHIAAGQTEPVEITLPSALQPTFLVKDKGLGLSKDEILNVYGRYGKSTKRNTNDQIGGFGIGAKAAFALGQQFVVTGIKDGIKTVVLFALNEQNIGQMTVVSEGPSDDHNGVTISLAVEEVEHFVTEAMHFFSKWERGTVLVNGEEVDSLFDDALRINDFTLFVRDAERHGLFLRMGQVAYPVTGSILSKVEDLLRGEAGATTASALRFGFNNALYLSAPIGSAEIAPSREMLIDSAQTVQTVADLLRNLSTDLESVIQTTVNTMPDMWSAAYNLWKYVEDIKPLSIDALKVTFHGRILPSRIQTPKNFTIVDLHRGGNKIIRQENVWFNSSRDPKTLLYLPESPNGAVLRAAKRILTETDYSKIVLTPEGTTGLAHHWFDTSLMENMTHEEFKALVKSLRVANPRRKGEPRYSVNTGYERDPEYRTPISEIIEEGLPLLIAGSDGHRTSNKYKREALEGVNIIALGGNQSMDVLLKAIEGHLDIVTFEEIEKKVRALAAADFVVTEAEREALGAKRWLQENHSAVRGWTELFDRIDTDLVTNSLVLDARDSIELANIISSQITRERQFEVQAASDVLSHEGSVITLFDASIEHPSSAFPLIPSYKHEIEKYAEDVLLYLNCKG